MPSLHTECTYSQIQWQNLSWGVTSAALQEWLWPLEYYWQSWQGAAFFACLGAGVLQPKQHPHPCVPGRGCAQWKEHETGSKTPDHRIRHERVSRTQERRVLILNCSTSISFISHLQPPGVTYALWLWTLLTLNFSLFSSLHPPFTCISQLCPLRVHPLFPGSSLFSWSIYKHDQHHLYVIPGSPSRIFFWFQTKTSQATISNKLWRKTNHLQSSSSKICRIKFH